MNLQDYINKAIRPFIGDGYEVAYVSEVSQQPRKYAEAIIVDIINEAVQVIARRSDLFEKTGYSLIKAGARTVEAPKGFLGFTSTEDFSAGVNTDEDATYEEIELKPTKTGFIVVEPLTERDMEPYKVDGLTLPMDVVDELVASGQIKAPDTPILIRDLLTDRVLVSYKYKYMPPEYKLDTEIEFGELYTLIRWYTCSTMLYADLSNESADLAQIYYKKFAYILEKAGQDETNYSNVALARTIRSF